MYGIQLIAAVFALAMMYQAYINFRRRDMGATAFLLWEATWLALLAVSVFPGPFQAFIHVVHVARLLDLVTIVGLLLFAGITYRLFVLARRLQNRLDALVRRMALADLSQLPSDQAPPAIS